MPIEDLRKQFPILNTQVNGKPLAYLDNAATTQKPQTVCDAINRYYTELNSNVHRGVHYLSAAATTAYEASREKVRDFINARSIQECIFVRGTTEGINLVASSFGEAFIEAGDEILISQSEHHSNIVPWQLLCDRKKAKLIYIPINAKGEWVLDNLDQLITDKTKMVAISHVSNALGTINPIETVIKQARAKGAAVLIDGAQAAPHIKIDVQTLDCDFYAFSAHKMYGPTGIGVLYGKKDFLEKMPPYHGGGEMILSVSMDSSTFNELPYKFEAGTPAIAEVIAFAPAIDFVNDLHHSGLIEQEKRLLAYATEKLQSVPGLKLIGTAENKVGVLSFTLEMIHPHDIGSIVDQHGIAIRTGHHCAQPIMDFFSIPATARASLACYNTEAEIDRLADALLHVNKIFKRD